MRELFSRRQAMERGEVNDIFIYDTIPADFKKRFYMIIKTLYKAYSKLLGYDRAGVYFQDEVNSQLAMAFADLSLDSDNSNTSILDLLKFLNKCNDEMFIDALDQILSIFHNEGIIYIRGTYNSYIFPEAVKETNDWLKYCNLGYRFENGQLIKVSNEYLHQEVIMPALKLISDNRFSVADSELRKSNEHRVADDFESAITEAGKALESVMKVICTIMGYQYDEKGSASSLLKTLKDNDYFPSFLENQVNTLINMLYGLPTLRNKVSHGAGTKERLIFDNYAAYAFHMLTSDIVFLISLLPK